MSWGYIFLLALTEFLTSLDILSLVDLWFAWLALVTILLLLHLLIMIGCVEINWSFMWRLCWIVIDNSCGLFLSFLASSVMASLTRHDRLCNSKSVDSKLHDVESCSFVSCTLSIRAWSLLWMLFILTSVRSRPLPFFNWRNGRACEM